MTFSKDWHDEPTDPATDRIVKWLDEGLAVTRDGYLLEVGRLPPITKWFCDIPECSCMDVGRTRMPLPSPQSDEERLKGLVAGKDLPDE